MRNLVLICLDSVRKDVFEQFAPGLGARSDVSYNQCRAASTWSVPSHASMFTGALPSKHGVHSHNLDFSTIDSDETVCASLPDHAKMSISANGFTNAQFGFDSLFDRCLTARHTQRFPAGLDAGEKTVPEILRAAIGHDHPLKSLANGAASKLYWLLDAMPVPQLFDQGATLLQKHALEELDRTSEPFFLFLNFMEAHVPHKHFLGLDRELHDVEYGWTSTRLDLDELNRNRPESLERHVEDVDRFREIYAASVDYLDRQVIELIDSVAKHSSRETTFVVTADHGENLGYPSDEYMLEHTASLSEGLLHVPLVLIDPPGDSCANTEGFVSHLALPDLLVGLANGRVPDLPTDRIPAELVGGGTGVEEGDPFWDRMVRCAYDYEQRRKFEWDSLGNRAVYELEDSRSSWQTLDSEAVDPPEWARDFFDRPITEAKRLAAASAETDGTDDLTESTRRHLEELGYL